MRYQTAFLVLGFVICTSCGPTKPSEPDPTELIGDSAQGLQQEVAELRTEVEGLRRTMDRFDDENWRDVVPDAKEATTAIEGRLDTLESSADEVAGLAASISQMYDDAQAEANAAAHDRP